METKYLGYEIEITQDEYPEDPREWSELGTMLCSHKRYELGDEKLTNHGQGFAENFMIYLQDKYQIMAKYIEETEDYLHPREIKQIQKWIEKNIIYEELFLYDHSGITMSTGSFGCRWDSGQVGYIYAHKDDIRKWHNIKKLLPHHLKDAERLLNREVEMYDKYLVGDIHELHIPLLDECVGGFESEDEALAEAKVYIDNSDPEGKIMKEGNRIYEASMDEFWDTFNILKNESKMITNKEGETDSDKKDLLIEIVGNKLRKY